MTLPDSEVFAEWLVVNRLGCYALGTPCRLPERKYHGLLVARSSATSDPWHVLAEVSECVRVGAEIFELGSFYYGDCIHPRGYLHQVDFSPSPPTWRYRCGEATIVRRLALADDAPLVTISYTVEAAPQAVELTVTPLFTGRSAHHNTYESSGPRWHPMSHGGVEVWLPGTQQAVHVRSPGASRVGDSYWNRQVLYPEERRRGYPDREDLYAPTGFRWMLEVGGEVAVSVGLGCTGEAKPIAAPAAPSCSVAAADLDERLARAAKCYLVDTADQQTTVIAGYPWFGEWGRDAFIALPGLTLARGEHALAARVLDHFSAHRKEGLIPNIVGTSLESTNSNSVDATLFFIRAVRALDRAAGPELAKRWWPTVIDLLEVLRGGLAEGVRVSADGFLAADRRPRAMTWMDAIVDGEAVTPRAPFAVEIQALFHDAALYGLRVLGESRAATVRVGQPTSEALAVHWHEIVSRLEHNFVPRFGCGTHLADSIDGNVADTAVRPNQLYALIGARPLVRGPLARSVLEQVRRCLLTSVGLRTLDPRDPRYRGRCEGSQRERDLAYHQGTVWPWLLGPYLDAVAAVEGLAAARAESARVLEGFRGHLDRACWGHVSEIFDGDHPHTARGAPAQAWSVAELLRIARTYR